MTDLTPTSALGGSAPIEERIGKLTIRENTSLALASLAMATGSTTPSPLGLTLPGPGGWTEREGVFALWMAPDQWLIAGHAGDGTNLDLTVKTQVPSASVTDQTDGFVVFEIVSADGNHSVVRLLERLANVDPDCLGPGRAVRTLVDHMGVCLARRSEDRLDVIGMRSAAGSLWHFIRAVAAF